MNYWMKHELCEYTLSMRLPVSFQEKTKDIPRGTFPVFPGHVFTDGDVMLWIRYYSGEATDGITELQKLYSSYRKQGYMLTEVKLEKRTWKGIRQGVLQFYIDRQQENRLYRLVLSEGTTGCYLLVFSCLKENAVHWLPIFNRILNSMDIRIEREVKDGQESRDGAGLCDSKAEAGGF